MPHMLLLVQAREVVQPGSVASLQMLSRLAHLSGAFSGFSPQQSALVLQSLT